MSQGQFNQTDFFDNTGGLNLADSIFKVMPTQAVGGSNYDYAITGGFRKRLGPNKINSIADTQLKSLGIGLYNTSTSEKDVIRAAGTKLQLADLSVPSFTNLSEDTVAAGSNPLVSGSTVPVSFSQFNNGSSDVLWSIGGGQTLPNGVYSTTKYTQNGVAVPTTSSFIATSVGSGGTLSVGVYRYTLVYRKLSTQSISNALVEASVTCVANDSVNLAWTLTNNDTTKYDKIYIYRSTLNGATGFTTGDLIAQLASTAVVYLDTGSSIASSQNVPRAGNVVLDNSVLPAGTYNGMCVFKRRLVVAYDNTIILSDLNKSESWPLTNIITVPSGGRITALAVISFTSPQANTLDEILVIFKEREVWVLTGDSFEDWTLKFNDQVGCPNQTMIVTGNGFLSWIDFRGVYLWDGASKPIYCSRLLEPLFAKDGDLDKTRLNLGVGQFLRKDNFIVWYLSSKLYGEQKFALKMDLRLTLPKMEQTMSGRTIDAVIIPDTYAIPTYAALSFIPSTNTDEFLVSGDDAGFLYYAYNGYSDGGSNYSFTYKTKPLDMGDPNSQKYFHKVIAWVQNYGDWDLTLDYWSDYHTGTSYQTTKALPLNTGIQNAVSLWDIALWDVALWDDFLSGMTPVVFNLEPGVANSNQGSALQVQFRNDIKDQPIIIYGFSVQWSEMGGITA